MLEVFTDGAKNKHGSGWAFVALAPQIIGEPRQIIRTGWGRGHYEATNNQMELQAVVFALKANRTADVLIVSDSQYVVNGFTEWLPGWIARDWKTKEGEPVANRKLWQQIIHLQAGRRILFRWVKGHKGDEFNELCDRLCTTASRGGDPSQHLHPPGQDKTPPTPAPARRKRQQISRKIKTPTHQHRKGGIYEVITDQEVYIEAGWQPAVLYLSSDGKLVVRNKEEFYDGRFTPL